MPGRVTNLRARIPALDYVQKILREAVWMASRRIFQIRRTCLYPPSPIFSEFITFQRGRLEHSNRNFKMNKYRLLAAFFCALSPLAHAATATSLDEVVVAATRISQPLAQSLASVSIITQKDIQNSQAIDVPSLLKNLAGVEFYQSGGIGKQSSIFMRGTNSSHVLVLLDGVRINSATTGTTAIDQIMLDQVERIEVVRGNVSSLYGSEGIGGVIQIFTKRGKGQPSFNASAGTGTHNTQRAAAGFGGEIADTAFNVQVSKFKTDGISAVNTAIAPGANPNNNGYDNLSVSANLRHAFTQDHSLSASLFNGEGNASIDNPYAASPTDVRDSRSTISKFSLVSDNRFTANWQSQLQWAEGTDNLKNFLNGAPDTAIYGTFQTKNSQLAWQNTLSLNEHNTLLLGAENLNQRVDSSTAYTQTSRQVDSVFAGHTAQFDSHHLQLNIRQDQYSDFGMANTGLAGYGYNINDVLRVTASTSTAFKAPTLNDLYFPFTDYGWGYSYVGNPNLKPERSRNSELGVRYSKDGQRLDVVYFDNEIRDLIVFNNQPAGSVINLNQARIDGVEVTYATEFGDTAFKAALTGQNPRDTQTGQTLLRRAKLFSNASLSQQLGAWRVGGEWQYSGERKDIHILTGSRVTLGSYSLVNLTAHYKLHKHLDLSLRADNVFNNDYILAHGYNTLGRTLFIGVNYR